MGAACLNGLVRQEAEGQWPGSADVSVEAGLGTDFDLFVVEVGNVVARSSVGVELKSAEAFVLRDIWKLDTLSLTLLEALVKLNEWKNRLCLESLWPYLGICG